MGSSQSKLGPLSHVAHLPPSCNMSRYLRGGLAELAFWIQVANAGLPPVLRLIAPGRFACRFIFARYVRTQVGLHLLLLWQHVHVDSLLSLPGIRELRHQQGLCRTSSLTRCNADGTSATTRLQGRMNQLLGEPPFPLPRRLAAAVATLALGVLWLPALPASSMLALAGRAEVLCISLIVPITLQQSPDYFGCITGCRGVCCGHPCCPSAPCGPW